MISIGTISHRHAAIPFAAAALCLAFVAATVAACAPIAFSIATVFLFAGPHNWIEIRYFLSRMPARFGPLKEFFTWSFAGLGLLMASYVCLYLAINFKLVDASTSGALYAGWDSLLVMWVAKLTLLAGARRSGRDWGWALPLGLFIVAFIWLSPQYFGLSLVYLHPLVGLCILDREISRSRPDLQNPYRLSLLAIPLLLIMICSQLSASAALPNDNFLNWQITHHAGADILPGCSSHLLVSIHTFLEMIHYGVWLLAIPFVSLGWRAWQPRSIPLSWRSPTWSRLVSTMLLFSSFAVVALWCAFAFNYSATRDIYFTLALVHVLAEIPFLLKALM